jgi:multiple sugar transport system ATP-binding protein
MPSTTSRSPLTARDTPGQSLKEKVGAVARLLKIDHVLGHAPRELSNGQKQRTALARALVAQPKVLLLDDPLRNVDAKLRYEMRLELPRLLRSYNAAVIYVTQDYKEAMALGDRIAVLRGGKIEQWAHPARRLCHTGLGRGGEAVRRSHHQSAAVQGGAGRDPAARPQCPGAASRHWSIGRRGAGRSPPRAPQGQPPLRSERHPCELDAVMPVNVRSVLYLRGPAGEEILATVGESEAAKFGRDHRQVWVDFAPENVLLFDAASGARIGHQAH